MNKQILIILFLSFTAIFPDFAQDKRAFDIICAESQGTPRILACRAPEFSFHLPQMAGNFRIGISNGEKSLWSDESAKVEFKQDKNRLIYTLEDPILNKGKITLSVSNLSDSDGIIMQIESKNIADDIQLIWSFGGCSGKILENPAAGSMKPEYCKYNVFSVERTSFTVYYGESMNLKVFMGISPLESDIRLSDAHKQESPLSLFRSGKNTDAPVLAAMCPLENAKPLYFCFYVQNRKADYNYFMLPELFRKEYNK